MEPSAKESYEFCKRILPQVSRTFALNIAVLTGSLHKAILVAYLLCRIADTIEDSEQLTSETRRSLLDEYVRMFTERDYSVERIGKLLGPFAHLDSDEPYNRLVRNFDRVLRTFLTLPDSSQQAISDCVVEMSQGMKETVSDGSARQGPIRTLESVEDLEKYCYYVAGTVGIMLTRLFAIHAPAMSEGAVKLARELEVSFGLGLQITNIIKDCYDDYNRGWCYIPSQMATARGLQIGEFFLPANQEKSLGVLRELIRKAASHLDDALDYTLLIPRREVRMRLFCLWPLFFAIETLLAADGDPALVNGQSRVKISRRQVYGTILSTTLRCWNNRLLKRSYRRLRERLESS